MRSPSDAVARSERATKPIKTMGINYNFFIIAIIIACLSILIFIVTKLFIRLKRGRLTPIVNNYIRRENEIIENGDDQKTLEMIFVETINEINNNIRETQEILHDDMNNIIFIANRRPGQNTLQNIELFGGEFEPALENHERIIQHIAEDLIWQIDELERLARQKHQQHIKSTNKTKPEQVKEYFTNVKKVRSDGQNVHDSSVNKDLRETYFKLLMQTNCAPKQKEEYFKEMVTYVTNFGSSKSVKTLNHILQTNPIVFSLGRDVRLQDVLTTVWNRSYHSNNKAKSDELRKALVDALNDCEEHGSIVCTGGITGRLLTSLTLLDFDESIGNIQTVEQHKNDILSKSAVLLDNLVKELLESDTTELELKKYAQTFVDMSVDDKSISLETKKRFEMLYGDRVDELLNQYNDKIIPKNMKSMIMEAI